jgi:ABC-type transport system involved in multi-copper enzyme maturation permease subunit
MNQLVLFTANEYVKLFYQTKTKILIALSVLSALAIGIGSFIINNNTGIQMVAPERFPMFVLELLTGFVMPVLTIFIGSELLSSEFKDGTIKNLFALPISKSIIYLGKIFAGAIEIGIYLLIIGVSSIIVSGVINGTEAFGNLGGLFISYLGAFIFLIMLLIITSFVTLLVGSPGMAIVMNLFIWFGIGVTGIFLTNIKEFLPTSFTKWYQPLVNGVNLAMALPPLLYMISYCVIFIVAGMVIFERKEV